MKLIVHGQAYTKKTSNVATITRARPHKTTGKVGGQPCPACGAKLRALVFPSEAWRNWVRQALVTIEGARLLPIARSSPAAYLLAKQGETGRAWRPITARVSCRAIFYRKQDGPGDLVGYFQGLADLLEKRGVLEDDSLIRSWDGSRLDVDRQQPRVEVELVELAMAQASLPLPEIEERQLGGPPVWEPLGLQSR